MLNEIGNSSKQGVDGVFGNITKHTGSDFKEFKENTPILETEVAKDSNFTFKLGWESRNMEKKAVTKGPQEVKVRIKKKYIPKTLKLSLSWRRSEWVKPVQNEEAGQGLGRGQHIKWKRTL